ncbi:antitoxin Xre/MbcA/ParS toxin-binding domain-containing protein [Variovorax sp. Sphag1AA]|uniref:antitoxin Xre/MbcA/ParS toxin-binding domain-containing protein n=1 Tax=Variovorax sp. Sphag1AA TaxID=2587027 RepID=UPI0017B4ED1D|nr:hypothetical protein [Variovorax sp. Sphag1AA]
MTERRWGQSTGSSQSAPARSYVAFWTADRTTWNEMVAAGLPPDFLNMLAQDIDIGAGQLAAWLELYPEGDAFIATAGVLAVARLVGQVETIVSQSGNPDRFDAARWIGTWLAAPHPALGGRTPAEYLSSEDGRALLECLLGRMQSGAYS